MIEMYPLRLLADRSDVGGISTPNHCDLNGKCGIFVYDGHRGGVGYAERGYEIIADILEVTLRAIEGCSCYEGCPSCVQSQKWGNHNDPLDKHAALIILHELLGKPSYIPKKAKPQKIRVPPQQNSDNARRNEEKKHQEEIKFCEKQLEINPKNWTAWYNKGLAHYQLVIILRHSIVMIKHLK